MSAVSIQNTSARNNLFSNKAGKNFEKATGLRRAAEAASHMGTDPYSDTQFGIPPDDFNELGEGVHDIETKRQ